MGISRVMVFYPQTRAHGMLRQSRTRWRPLHRSLRTGWSIGSTGDSCCLIYCKKCIFPYVSEAICDPPSHRCYAPFRGVSVALRFLPSNGIGEPSGGFPKVGIWALERCLVQRATRVGRTSFSGVVHRASSHGIDSTQCSGSLGNHRFG